MGRSADAEIIYGVVFGEDDAPWLNWELLEERHGEEADEEEERLREMDIDDLLRERAGFVHDDDPWPEWQAIYDAALAEYKGDNPYRSERDDAFYTKQEALYAAWETENDARLRAYYRAQDKALKELLGDVVVGYHGYQGDCCYIGVRLVTGSWGEGTLIDPDELVVYSSWNVQLKRVCDLLDVPESGQVFEVQMVVGYG